MSPSSSKSRGRCLAVVAIIAAALTGAGTWSAAASQCVVGLCLGSTTTTAPPPPPPPPPAEGEAPPPPPSPGITLPPDAKPGEPLPAAPPPPPPAPAPAPGSPPPPAVEGGEGDDTAEPPADAGPFPEHLRRQMNSVKRTGANDTTGLLAALAPLAEFGVTPEQAALIGFGQFPVAGEARYSHDWWFPRFGPGWRLHMGTDIFAAMGTPVRAPFDGTVKITNSPLGGLAVYVVAPNRDFWYLAHLAGIPDGIAQGTSVRLGDVVGFTGDSGNARGGAPHVHAEFHPGGGGAVDPKPFLDQFIADAEAAAPGLVQHYRDQAAAGQPVAAPPGFPAWSAGGGSAGADPPRSALLWATAMNPSGGALALAEAEAARIASSVDWTVLGREAQPAPDDQPAGLQRAAVERALHGWWGPLTPLALASALAGPAA